MKERPILFSTPMVRAILDGSKTLTRRVVRPARDRDMGCDLAAHEIAGEVNAGNYRNCPYGYPGDRLYVRETWQHSNHPYGPLERDCAIFYRADYFNDPHGMNGEKSPEGKYREWRPSIHMPRWASRITLEITGVRVERLQEISEADAMAEGAEPIYFEHGNAADRGLIDLPLMETEHPYRNGYASLWESINGPGSWDANPWVWVVEFRRIEK